ncbi:hypothetical protein BDZ94DRAFT_1132023, partial [Collybia nuda]
PSYARDLIWTDEDNASVKPPTLAHASEIMPPLSPVPTNELLNHKALNTIHNHPHLFTVSSSIDIPAFRNLLISHPNQPLVDSVCNGLQYGFWPWAETSGLNLPTTFGNVYPLRDEGQKKIARAQRDKEI